MLITIITLILAAAGFVWGRIRADIVALVALLVLTLSGILTTQEALSGFSNPVVIMMVGLFVVGGAIFNTGLWRQPVADAFRRDFRRVTVFYVALLHTAQCTCNACRPIHIYGLRQSWSAAAIPAGPADDFRNSALFPVLIAKNCRALINNI